MYDTPEQIDAFFDALVSFKKGRILGEGAFGLAVLAFDETEKIHKVFKLPKSEKTTQALKIEGDNLVKLRQLLHNNIVQMYQYGMVRVEENGRLEDRYFLCLAFGGTSLRAKLGDVRAEYDRDGNPRFRGSGNQLPIEEGLKISIDICQGLEAAHGFQDQDVRLIHRDIKPDNILIDDETGVARITDFGVSRVIDRSTGIASVAGTLLYMDPECFKGKAGMYSDIYSFGIVMYEMFTGELPFPDFPSRIKGTIIPPSEHNKEIPPDLSDLILKTLEADLSKRYVDARDLLKDLRRVSAGCNPVPPRYERLRPAGAACHLCRDTETGQRVHLYLVESEAEIEELEREAALLNTGDTIQTKSQPFTEIIHPSWFFRNEHFLGIVAPAPDGRSLPDVFRNGMIDTLMSLKKFCEIMSGVCDAVADGHALGLMHGFLSPGHICIDDIGAIAICGFGLGPIFRRRLAAPKKGADVFVRTFRESLPFMSQQVFGAEMPLTPADDVFSLGAILHLFLVGRPPEEPATIKKDSPGEDALDASPHNPRAINPILPESLASVMLKMLDSDPRNRPTGLREIADTLRQCCSEEKIAETLVRDALRVYEDGDALRAYEILEQAIDVDPGNPKIHYTRGLIYYREKEHKWAAEELQKAANVEPNKDVYVLLGRSYAGCDNQQESAAEAFQKALEYGEDEEIRKLYEAAAGQDS